MRSVSLISVIDGGGDFFVSCFVLDPRCSKCGKPQSNPHLKRHEKNCKAQGANDQEVDLTQLSSIAFQEESKEETKEAAVLFMENDQAEENE